MHPRPNSESGRRVGFGSDPKEAARVRPALVHVFPLNWGTRLPTLEKVVSRLGDEWVCVRPDELDRLFRESRH